MSFCSSVARKPLFWLTSALSLLVSLYGLANVMPAIGDFRLGPFPMIFFRATFFALCVLVVLLGFLSAGEKRQPTWVMLVGGLLSVGLIWSCWSFYDVSIMLDESMFLFGSHEMWIALLASAGALFFCWRIWGAPVALLGIFGIAYMATGHLWPGPLKTVSGSVEETLAQNLLYSLDAGILGSTFSVVITTVFPFIILGAVLEGVGAGDSMIRIAFSWMRRAAGGPAHAAVLSSALFGTVSGSAVGNVVGTGVVTIPMIKRRGFTSNFAGAVEAAASTGGQIMPPIMGAAALVMADFVGVSYLTVIVAILVPSIAYYCSLFAMILFETRRLGIKATTATESDLDRPTRQDYLNLLLIFLPLALIVTLLVAGLSPSGASISALALLFPLSLINPAVRAQPARLLKCLCDGGSTFAQLLMAIAAVSIVISALSVTGVPVKFGTLLSSMVTDSLMLSLIAAAACCIILGMGMPTLPAYVTVATIAIPAMQQLGLEPLTAHLFVFLIAVASAITPPVAIAAYAAASISGGRPIATSVQASKVGIMIFIIPFIFAYNPLLLIVEQAGAAFELMPWLWLIVKLALGIYLLATALTGFDRTKLRPFEIALRLGATFLLFVPDAGWDLAGFALAAVLCLGHYWTQSKTVYSKVFQQ
ncbi:C4-dicarboxylate ABC transporter permease [Marinobacterium nitratireducens]|uniref:C4-dicarboxylate ABC transporter permease n=1 Tax=Marinobacterium nitratireducens TaxID=518897 RepID=A0A917ZIS0_9GAMM|nr:TRAP transporter fused permease subunit [Marinobacterium nitratireducens]GGO83416.1 C4-dicarboxylate ABC transporter permease [Marinobacterium nitratireducens]